MSDTPLSIQKVWVWCNNIPTEVDSPITGYSKSTKEELILDRIKLLKTGLSELNTQRREILSKISAAKRLLE